MTWHIITREQLSMYLPFHLIITFKFQLNSRLYKLYIGHNLWNLHRKLEEWWSSISLKWFEKLNDFNGHSRLPEISFGQTTYCFIVFLAHVFCKMLFSTVFACHFEQSWSLIMTDSIIRHVINAQFRCSYKYK